MVDNLYHLYESCLGVWILDTYKQLNKNKNIASLKLLLKLRDINFFKRLNFLVLNCRGDLKDPLLQFLLYLIKLVDSNTSQNIPTRTNSTDKDHSNTPRDNLTATDDNTLDSQLNTSTNTNTDNTNQNNTNSDLNRGRLVSARFNQNKFTVTNTNLNTTKSNKVSPDQRNLIDGYVVFINLFLCSLIPTLLYTYLNRVGNNKYNKLQVLHSYYNYVNKSESGCKTNFSYKKKYNKKPVVYKSFRNESERMVLRTKRFKNLMDLVYTDEDMLVDELMVYNLLFSSTNKSYNFSIYDNLNDLDNVSGLELVLYKLTLLVNNNFNNNNMYNELPSNIYNIYNKLSSNNILKSQIENNLIYCYRLRINDLNMKLNMNKIFKSLVKYNKKSDSNKFYNPCDVDRSYHSGDLNGFNDLDVLNVMSNSLLLFNNNLLYLNKFLGGNNNTNTNMSYNNNNNSNTNNNTDGMNNTGGNTISNNSNYNSMLRRVIDVNSVDRCLHYAYNVINIINGNSQRSYEKHNHNKHSDMNTNIHRLLFLPSKSRSTSSMEYLYNTLLGLMRYVFSLDSNNTDGMNNTSSGSNESKDVKEKDNRNTLGTTSNGSNMNNKYELFDLKRDGRRRVHLSNNLCLLILKLNYDFYKLLTINTNTTSSYSSSAAGNLSGRTDDQESTPSQDRRNIMDEELTNKSYLDKRLKRVLDKIKLRMEYEVFPTSYWLVSSQLSLLKFKLSSQCQSKPP